MSTDEDSPHCPDISDNETVIVARGPGGQLSYP
jgi:hypothetical protein